MIRERWRWFCTKCGRLFLRGRQEAALDAELQFHLDQLIAEFRADGMAEQDARRAARREFGASDLYREETRDAWRPLPLADMGRSVRFAIRSLARSPGFTLIAIITLAFGIGANTTMFHVLNTVAFKPLPYPKVEDIELIFRSTSQDRTGRISPADFLEFLPEAEEYGEVAAFAYGDVSFAEPGEPADFAPSIRVTANFFSVLGMRPQLGRDFSPEEERRGNHRRVLISDRCWRVRFGGDRDVVGRVVRVDGEPHEIVGVLPIAFNDWRHLGWVDVFRPLGLTTEELTDRNTQLLHLIGRRAPGVSPGEAAGLIAGFGERLAAGHPDVNAGSRWRTESIDFIKLGESGNLALGMMLGLSGFVLLIACLNLANLLLARTMGRAREFAVRGALGASRLQLLRPLVLESLVLALTGGACAVLVAVWGTAWLQNATTGDNGEQVVFTLDWAVLGWAFVASLVTAVVFGLAPALFAMRLDLNGVLKSGGRTATDGRGRDRLRRFLIIGQFAFAMVLLTGAGLAIRGIQDLNTRRQGWESDQLVTGTFLLPSATYPDHESITAFHRRALEGLEALPGVTSASVSYHAPFLTWYDPRKYIVAGRSPPEPGREPAALINGVSPDYFATVGTRVLAGRVFDARDTSAAPRVFIINESMATGLFGDENPIGQRLARVGTDKPQWGEIVGVVRDVKSIFPDPAPVTFQLYWPMAQEPRAYNELAVRTAGIAPATLVGSIRQLMAELDPDLPMRNLKPTDARIERANYQNGVMRDMLCGFAVLGLGLAAMGIYGVIARLMAQRSGEFGIRLALGAQLRDISRLVLASGVKLALAGSALGLIGSIGLARLFAVAFPLMRLERIPVIAGATLLLIVVALTACYLPARRAARISPVEALRAE